MSWRSLNSDGVTRDQLGPDQHGAEHHLETVEEVIANDDDGAASSRPSLTGGDRLDTGDRCCWIQPGIQS